MILNQFGELGNYIAHRAVTGPALEEVFHEAQGAGRLKARAFVAASGSAGTLAAGDHLKRALEDSARRAESHFGKACGCHYASDLGAALVEWVKEENLEAIVSLQPFVGSLGDQMPQVESELREAGVSLVLVRREHDAEVMRHASRGFFGFWKKVAPLAFRRL